MISKTTFSENVRKLAERKYKKGLDMIHINIILITILILLTVFCIVLYNAFRKKIKALEMRVYLYEGVINELNDEIRKQNTNI